MGLPWKTTQKLLLIQNAAAWLLSGAEQNAHVTPILQTVHLLLISYWVQIKADLGTIYLNKLCEDVTLQMDKIGNCSFMCNFCGGSHLVEPLNTLLLTFSFGLGSICVCYHVCKWSTIFSSALLNIVLHLSKSIEFSGLEGCKLCLGLHCKYLKPSAWHC